MVSTASVGSAVRNGDSEHAVRGVVAAFADAWNHHDMRAFAQLFALDADFVNWRSQSMTGRAAIEGQHTAIHATIYKDSRMAAQAVAIRLLRPDVALAHVTTEVAYNAGKDTRASLLTLVLTNESDRWMIAAAHNTLAGDPRVAPPRPT
jgi:uncharacterized protein (TIGR02246 family)